MRRGLMVRVGVVSTMAVAVSAANGITIAFDYSRDALGFFSDPARRTVLNQAASYFTGFTDSLLAITPSGVNQFTAVFSNPATGLDDAQVNLSVPADTLIVYAGGRDIPGTTLGIGGPGGYGAGGYEDFLDVVERRGQAGATNDPATATDFATWGGSITFDTSANWNFGAGSPSGTQNDFLSVAIHELAHVLGMGTAASYDHWVSGSVFTGPTARSKNGGADVPLNGDASHWQNGKTSTLPGSATVQETALDPSLTQGTRKVMTVLDYAAMADIGWQVPASLLAGASLAGDVNGDGVVNLGDINYVTARWLNAGPAGDANGDGVVNLGDINYITARWLNASEPSGIAVGALAVVPEPGAALLLIGMPLLIRRRGRRW